MPKIISPYISSSCAVYVGVSGESTKTSDMVSYVPAPTAQIAVRDGRGLNKRPWPHQASAIDFLQKALRKDGGGSMLAMAMGTGKSIVAVSMAANLPIDDLPVLFLSPLRVVPVLEKEFEKHADFRYRYLALDDRWTINDKTHKAIEHLRICKASGYRPVIGVNYDSAWRDPFRTFALNRAWGLVVCDESHKIKAPDGRASRFCRLLSKQAKFRLAMTGTPMAHGLLDAWAQFDFLLPGYLSKTFYGFRYQYAVMGGYLNKQVVGYRNQDVLSGMLAPYMFQAPKSVLTLPPETQATYSTSLGPAGRRAYAQMDEEMVAGVMDGTITAANAMVKLLRLQQICGGSVVDDVGNECVIDTAKAQLLEDTLEDIGPDDPVVVFCRFRSDLKAVHAACKNLAKGFSAADEKSGYAPFSSLELSGSRDELASWKDGRAQVLAVQIQSGGVGIDLTRARYSIFYSLSFSLAEYDQAKNRIHRPGQTRPVTQIHLVIDKSVDQKIMRALEKRHEVIQSVLQQIKEQNER